MNANRLAALGFGISLALLVTLVVVWRRWPTDAPPSGADEQARAEAVRQLVQASSGSFDSHVDPEVGHVLLPGIEGGELRGQPLSTNRFGLREEEFATPPPGKDLGPAQGKGRKPKSKNRQESTPEKMPAKEEAGGKAPAQVPKVKCSTQCGMWATENLNGSRPTCSSWDRPRPPHPRRW